PQTRVWPAGQRIHVGDVWIRASCLQMSVGGVLRRDLRSIHEQEWVSAVAWGVSGRSRLPVGKNRAISNGQGLGRSKRIFAGGQWQQLVELTLDRQMCPLTPHISDINDIGSGQFALNPEAPLLRVGPDRSGGNGSDVERKHRTWRRIRSTHRTGTRGIVRVECRSIANVADAGVADRKLLRHAEHNRRAGFERSGISFVAGTVLEKYSIAATNRRLAVSPGIPGKADPRRRIEQMTTHAACGRAVNTALHQSQIAHYPGV